MKKKPYSRLLILILISHLLLFLAAFAVVNVLIPRRFELDARRTIESEIRVIKNDAPEDLTYLTGLVQFIFPDEMIGIAKDTGNASYLQNYINLQKLEKQEIIEYISENSLSSDICYLHENENGRYLLALLEDSQEGDPDSLLVIYINISPFFRYNFLWNWILFVLFLFISGIVVKTGSSFNRKFEESRETERKFFQNTSHGLKTPLMVIQGYAEGIISGIEEPVKASKVILEENERMTKLVEEFLYISRLDSQHFEMRSEKNDIREIIYDAMKTAEAAARANHIELLPAVPEEPVFIRCDEEQLIKALSNILSNAVDYAAGKISVTCSAGKSTLVIEIQDDGNGIDEKDLSHIFERFYTTRRGGTGIGLSLTYEIIKRHDGELEARNTTQGALFTVKLPVLQQ